jgi:GNAT superfamily N-acetyltransferase
MVPRQVTVRSPAREEGHDVLVQVRRAHVEDAAATADVWLRSRAGSIPAIPGPVHTSEEVHDHFERVIFATQEVWVAETGGTVVALLVLDEGWIEHLYVDPDYCGKGIGSRLLDIAKREQPGGLELWTFESNTGARRFYERHGFTVTGATPGDNEERAPDVCYAWRPR